MIEIILIMLVWCWGLTPLWFNIVATALLVLRFGWRCMLSVLKILEINKEG
jgi:hypothetical protein